MSIKPLVHGLLACGVLAFAASAAPAQDWWNPVNWFAPPPYWNGPAYGGCANGQCSPRPYGGYGGETFSRRPNLGQCANGSCGPAICGPNGCRRAPSGYPYQPYPMPSYGPSYGPESNIPAPMPRGRTNNYRPPFSNGYRSSPFYE